MNLILNEVRPFGKRGYPPICFKTKFSPPPYHKVYKKVISEMRKLLSLKIGSFLEREDSEKVKEDEMELRKIWTM